MTLNEKILSSIDASAQEALELLIELGKIPAPSHHEERRAQFCKDWLEKQGAKGVYIDEALNVIFPLNCEGKNEITVFVAHTDTVFPDLELSVHRIGQIQPLADVKANVPLGYSDGDAEVQVTMYSDGVLLNCFQLTEENCLAWLEND